MVASKNVLIGTDTDTFSVTECLLIIGEIKEKKKQASIQSIVKMTLIA